MRIPASGGMGVFEGVRVQVDRRVEVKVPGGRVGSGVSVRVGKEVDVLEEVLSGISAIVGEFSNEISVLDGSIKGTTVDVVVESNSEGIGVDEVGDKQAVRERIRLDKKRKRKQKMRIAD
jgi:hypothetical protein